MRLHDWARRHGVSNAAFRELLGLFGHATMPGVMGSDRPESAVAKEVRLEAAKKGVLLWRNNVGVYFDERGVPVRYGLANETSGINERVKSHDLVGIRPVTITPAHVGLTLGQFVSRETKAAGWKYRGTKREEAQLRFGELVESKGGDARFVTSTGSFD